MRREIMIEAYDDTSEIDSINEFPMNKTNLNLISNDNSRLEEGLNKFLKIKKTKTENQNAFNSGGSYDDESWYTNNDIDVMRLRRKVIPEEEKKALGAPYISIKNLNEIHRGGSIKSHIINNKVIGQDFTIKPKSDGSKIERTVNQDARELETFYAAAKNKEKYLKSQKENKSSIDNDETLTLIRPKNIFKKSITHKNNTIYEESSDSEYDNNKHQKVKEEFFKQEKLFKKRKKLQNKGKKTLKFKENKNLTLTRITRIKDYKQQRIQKLKEEELTIDFEDDLINQKQRPNHDTTNERMIDESFNQYTSKEKTIEDLKVNQLAEDIQIHFQEPGVPGIDESANEQLDF